MSRPRLAAAALALAAAAALLIARGRGPAPSPGSAAGLPAPEPSPRRAQAPAYSNEDAARALQEEASRMGISSFSKPRDPESSGGSFLGERLGRPDNRANAEAYIRELARLRRPFEKARPQTVPLEGSTAGLLSRPAQGRPVEAEPAAPPQAEPAR